MNSIYLNGIGLVSRAGNTPDALAESIKSPQATEDSAPQTIAYVSFFEKSELRRINRYAKLAAEVSARCLEDAGINAREQCGDRTGILFTTGYGAAESNVKFFKSVHKKEPDFCNPLTFASMVPNYALGTVCILLKLHGYSTTLLGGNPFDIAIPVLNAGKADSVIVGAQEEYCPEVFEAADSIRTSHDVALAEGSIAFSVSREASENCYAQILYSHSSALSASPLLHDGVEFPKTPLDLPEQPDLIFGIGEQIPFGKQEKEYLSEIFPSATYTSVSREIFGETLGSSFFLNIAAAAVSLRSQISPVNENTRCILATGCDVQGNYMQVLLKKIEVA